MKHIRQLNFITRIRLNDKTLPETWNPGEEVPPQQAMAGRFHTRRNVEGPSLRRTFSPHLPLLLTISGAAIVKSRNNFLFHYKSKRDGEQAANGSVQSGNISTKSLSLVDSVITANGMIAGNRVTQPAGGIR